LQSAQGLTRFTTGHATGAASFETIEQIERDTDAEPLYRGQPILEQLPNWREHPGADFRRQVEILDNLTGTVLLQDRSNLSEPVHSFLWSAFGRAEVGEQRNFLYSRRGRFKGIWVPTFSSDLRLVAQIGPAEVNIDVEACGLTQFVGADVHRKDIRIELIDGTVYYRRVSVFVVVDESTERMTISSALGTTVDPEEVALISWMMFARLDADEVDIEWPTAGLAETTLTLTGPRNER
jgi:hypothetical protein